MQQWLRDDLGGQRGSVGRPGRKSREPFARFRGRARPLRDYVLLRRRVDALVRRASGVIVLGDAKVGEKRPVDGFLVSKRHFCLADVVEVGPEVLELKPGDRVVLATNSSVRCPECGEAAKRSEPDRRGMQRCARCGRRWPRDEGIALGGTGWNPEGGPDGSSYLIFMRERQVLAVVDADARAVDLAV